MTSSKQSVALQEGPITAATEAPRRVLHCCAILSLLKVETILSGRAPAKLLLNWSSKHLFIVKK